MKTLGSFGSSGSELEGSAVVFLADPKFDASSPRDKFEWEASDQVNGKISLP